MGVSFCIEQELYSECKTYSGYKAFASSRNFATGVKLTVDVKPCIEQELCSECKTYSGCKALHRAGTLQRV